MTEHEADDFLQKCVRQQRVIALALLGGPIIIGILFVALHFTAFEGKPVAPDLPRIGANSVLTFVASFVAVGAVVVSFILPNIHRRQTATNLARRSPAPSPADGPALLVGWQTGNLVRMAMLEGAAVLGIVLFLVTGDFTCIAIAAILLAVQAAGLPSEPSVRGWLSQAQEELEHARNGSV
ncbi:MAG: hypothetical protein KF873_06130 [Gemmataceae bacterium]|nr:hypothetical protein [Gemmataceae bacterium]